jgi:hypothetical protein
MDFYETGSQITIPSFISPVSSLKSLYVMVFSALPYGLLCHPLCHFTTTIILPQKAGGWSNRISPLLFKKNIDKRYANVFSTFTSTSMSSSALYKAIVGHTAHKSYKPIGYVHELQANGIDDPIAFYKQEVIRLNQEAKAEKTATDFRFNVFNMISALVYPQPPSAFTIFPFGAFLHVVSPICSLL